MKQEKFDIRFFFTESVRFHFDMHDGKKRLVAQTILPAIKGKNVLDYGCGSGNYSALYAREAKKVYAYDSSSAAIIMAESLNSAPNITYTLTDGTLLMPADVPQIVIFNDVLEFDPDALEVLDRCIDFLPKGGEVYITCPSFVRHTRSFVTRLFIKFLSLLSCSAQTKRKASEIVTLFEPRGLYHGMYNKDFPSRLEEHLTLKGIPFVKEPFALSLPPFGITLLEYKNHLFYRVQKM